MRKLAKYMSGSRQLLGELSAALVCVLLASCSQNPTSLPILATLEPSLSLPVVPTQGIGPIPTETVPDFAALIPPAPPGFGQKANHLTYYSDKSGDYELLQIDLQGANESRLAGSPIYELEPAWSPDGKFVAFVSTHVDGYQQMFLLESATGKVTQLTHFEADSWTPAWSPDSRALLFSSPASGDDEIYRLELGGEPQNLTNSPASNETLAVWSPDGSQIAFVSDRFGDLDVLLMKADGSEVSRLTEFEGMDTVPAWSPDGNRIAYVSFLDENFDIYVSDLQGGQPVRLTDSLAYDWSPAWSPDGSQIVFTSTREHVDTYDVYLMNADGSGQTRLTSTPANDILPAWWP